MQRPAGSPVVSPGVQHDRQIFSEHRALFRNPMTSGPAPRRARRMHPYNPSTRQRPMWTHKFFCLATKEATSVPLSRSARDALSIAGLGEKTLSIRSNGSPMELHEKICEVFPPVSTSC